MPFCRLAVSDGIALRLLMGIVEIDRIETRAIIGLFGVRYIFVIFMHFSCELSCCNIVLFLL